MNNNVTEQIARNLKEQVPSDKEFFLVVVDKETSEVSVSADICEEYLVYMLTHIYKNISPFGRDMAKILIKNVDCETDSQEGGSLKINLN